MAIDEDPGEVFSFELRNAPSWLELDPATGTLSGTPAPEDVGMTDEIDLSVTDGSGAPGKVSFAIDVLPDSDGDGVADASDNCPQVVNDPQANLDIDGDGVGNADDAFPRDPSETADTDGDGIGDNQEIEEGTDPNDPDDPPAQTGLPAWLLYEANK